VLSASVDSVFVHKMWNDFELSKMVKGGIPFPMLSDAGFLIDPDGTIVGYEVLTPPVGRNVLETIRQIQAFQLVRESKGTQATPSGWRPGKDTLKPAPDLVGKVWEVWSVDKAFD